MAKKCRLKITKQYFQPKSIGIQNAAHTDKSKKQGICCYMTYSLPESFIRYLINHYIPSVLHLFHVQVHVSPILYQAVHLPGQSCLSSIQIPGT